MSRPRAKDQSAAGARRGRITERVPYLVRRASGTRASRAAGEREQLRVRAVVQLLCCTPAHPLLLCEHGGARPYAALAGHGTFVQDRAAEVAVQRQPVPVPGGRVVPRAAPASSSPPVRGAHRLKQHQWRARQGRASRRSSTHENRRLSAFMLSRDVRRAMRSTSASVQFTSMNSASRRMLAPRSATASE